MNTLSRDLKESISINAIERHIIENGLTIKHFLNKGDKEISFDGHLQVNYGQSDKKTEFMKKVDCQVKSTEVRRFSGKTANFRFSKDDLENYYRQGGCLLLLAEIRDVKRIKLYYKHLLPIELFEIKKELDNDQKPKKSKLIKFRELDETNLYRVCVSYIDELDKQPKLLIELSANPNEYKDFVFTSLTFNQTANLEGLLGHEFYRYGVKDNIKFPLDTVTVEKVIFSGIKPFFIKTQDGEVRRYNLTVKEISTENKNRVIEIEGCLSITVNKIKNELNYSMRTLNSINSQLKTLPFFIEFLKAKVVYFGEGMTADSYIGGDLVDDKDDLKETISDLENTYRMILDLEKVFDKLRIDKDLKLSANDATLRNLENLFRLFIKEDYGCLKNSDPDNISFTTIKLGEFNLLLFYLPNYEKVYIDPFSEDMDQIILTIDTANVVLTPYLKLRSDELVESININYSKINESIDKMLLQEGLESYLHMFNLFSLELIKAFDLTGNKEQLNICQKILSFSVEKALEEEEKLIYLINLMQTKSRLHNGLNNDDYEILIDSRKKLSKDNCKEMFGINVLLENHKEAKLIQAKYPQEILELKEYPIYALYK